MSAGTLPVSPLWAAIAGRDGRRCTCHGECGRRHYTKVPGKPHPPAGSPATRCDVEALPAHVAPGQRLIVTPADPRVSETRAAYLPAAELTTRCPACAGAIVRRARAVVSADTASENPGLF